MADKRFLYILKEDDTEFYRIGITHNITYRLGMLKGGNHRKLHLAYLIEFDKIHCQGTMASTGMMETY